MFKRIIAAQTSTYLQCTNLLLQSKHQRICNVQTNYCSTSQNINVSAMYKLIIAAQTSTYLQCTNLLLQSKHQRICNVQTYYCSPNINVSTMYILIIAVETSTYLQCINLLLQSKHQCTCNVQTYTGSRVKLVRPCQLQRIICSICACLEASRHRLLTFAREARIQHTFIVICCVDRWTDDPPVGRNWSTASGSSGTLRPHQDVFAVDANGSRRFGSAV